MSEAPDITARPLSAQPGAAAPAAAPADAAEPAGTPARGPWKWFSRARPSAEPADDTPAPSRADEEQRLTALAQAWGTEPILDEDDLKYERMRPLGDKDRSLLDWVDRSKSLFDRLRAAPSAKLCIRVKVKSQPEDNDVAWIITDKPDSPEVESARALLELKGWDVAVRPATRALVERAVSLDQALTATDVEEKFRELVAEALRDNVSDIHFEIRGDKGTTRFRIHGEMQEVKREDGQPRFSGPVIEQMGNYMFNRLAKRGARQFVSNMALNGSAQIKVGEQTVALRFSTAPDIRGVDIFVRVWRPDQKSLNLIALGYTGEHLHLLEEAMRRPYGVIVFSGPTGSGKSTSLTALLDGMPDEEKVRRKIVSLESPVERELKHVTHVAVTDIVDHGGWKALLGGLNRWDSNINSLGEIKDRDTAEAIMDLATSGKLTLTTLHASNVLSIPARMEDLGVDHRFLADPNFLVLLINQRLVPRLCPECRIPIRDGQRAVALTIGEADAALGAADGESMVARFTRLFRHEMDNGANVCVRRPGGCPSCKGVGIVGRVLVAEMVMIEERSRKFIAQRDWESWRADLEGSGTWSSVESHARRFIHTGEVDPADVEKLVCRLEDDSGSGAEMR